MTNLFPLPYWAPALKRVPIPLQVLEAAYAHADARKYRHLLSFPKTGTIASRLDLSFNLSSYRLARSVKDYSADAQRIAVAPNSARR